MSDVDTRNEDWLRTRSWDLPTDPVVCEQYGIDLVALLDLPAGEAMPDDLRAYAEAKRASLTADADFESKHPRDSSGKFGEGDGATASGRLSERLADVSDKKVKEINRVGHALDGLGRLGDPNVPYDGWYVATRTDVADGSKEAVAVDMALGMSTSERQDVIEEWRQERPRTAVIDASEKDAFESVSPSEVTDQTWYAYHSEESVRDITELGFYSEGVGGNWGSGTYLATEGEWADKGRVEAAVAIPEERLAHVPQYVLTYDDNPDYYIADYETKYRDNPTTTREVREKFDGVLIGDEHWLLVWNPDAIAAVRPEPVTAAGDFDEEKHPRNPAGTPGGGRFTSGDSGGDTADPAAEIDRMAAELPPPTDPAARGPAVQQLMETMVAADLETDHIYEHIPGEMGRYDTARAVQQNEIINDVLQRQIDAGATKGDTCIMLGGLPGAGKTSSFNQVIDPDSVVHISPDTFKEELAARGLVDVPAGVGKMEAATLMHEESSYMAKQLADRAMEQGYNCVWDITMGSQSSTMDRANSAREYGYKITGVFVDTSVETAAARAESRYAGPLAEGRLDDARWTPPENILTQTDPQGVFDSKNERVFNELKPQMESWVRIDAHGPAPQVAESSPGALVNGRIPL